MSVDDVSLKSVAGSPSVSRDRSLRMGDVPILAPILLSREVPFLPLPTLVLNILPIPNQLMTGDRIPQVFSCATLMRSSSSCSPRNVEKVSTSEERSFTHSSRLKQLILRLQSQEGRG